jgi:beta-lactamase class A
MLTRRGFAKFSLVSLIGARCGRLAAAEADLVTLDAAFAKIEAESGGRLGVAMLDVGSGTLAGHRADERFPMCSTFKALAVAAILARVDAGKERLSRRIAVESKDILSYAPVTKQHVGQDMTVGELCEAAVTLSDNTAANLLLASLDGPLGGPAAITAYARSLGDDVTRLDRNEPDLNESIPGDPRDTTTPAAMAKNLKLLATGSALSAASRDQLIAWLVGCKTGDARLRAGLPKSWRVGDKTGSGAHGSSNDVAMIWPDGKPSVIVASYLTETTIPDDQRNAVHAAVGRAVAAVVTG